MEMFEAGRDSEAYRGLQALYSELVQFNTAAFTDRQKRQELSPVNHVQIFQEWVRATQALVSHLRDGYAFPESRADAVGTEESRDACNRAQEENEAFLGLLAAKYLLSYATLMEKFGKNNQAAYDASGVHTQLMTTFPNLIRFGYAPLNEAMQLIPPPATY